MFHLRQFQVRPLILTLLLISLFVGVQPFTAQAASPNIVISQIYGGGGNASAPLRNDFVELFNRGTTKSLRSGALAFPPPP